MKHTRLVTLLLISFLIMVLVAGFSTVTAGLFGLVFAAALGALLILSFRLSSFIDQILCIQMRN